VLVRGESGTGKELVAQAIHEQSGRRTRPLVAVNCAAISAELVESELFGHEKGAFTGADARRIGRFEAAAQGTMFLDEIGDMPLNTQAKVLRVLETRAFERVGSTTPIASQARVIAATHRDLEDEVKKGRFREDLYYRLRVVEIVVPPLRERPFDIPALAALFAERMGERLKRPVKPFSPAALQAMARHAWPGNVRELRHAVEQAVVLAAGELIEEADLRLPASGRTPPQPAGTATAAATAPAAAASSVKFADAKQRAVEAFERAWLTEALAEHGGNVSRTAAAIGLARQSLQQKLRELGLRAGRDDAD
jgi:DNA-binding NtrC family response regulator